LKRSGWKGTVELVKNKKEDHCFYLFDLDGDKAQEMRHKFVSFLKQDQFNLKQDLAKFVLFDGDKAQEMRHRFSRFFEIKNRTETGRFDSVLVFLKKSVWLFFIGKNQTEPKMITPTKIGVADKPLRKVW